MTNPNKKHDPVTNETKERVEKAADGVLQLLGTNNGDGSMLQALVGVEYSALTEHPERALPTIAVRKAIGEFATQARWNYEITIGAQDEQASRHILLMRDEHAAPEVAYYGGQSDRPMTELEATAIATDLERVASQDA